MLADIKAGKIKRVVVKDMSRFGRNYLQVGMYTEMLFPEYGVHFIAVNDGVDSVRGDSEFTAIRNVFNEMYAKDTSKKIRATWQSKGRSGEHLTTIPPYGYKKDPENKKRWIVDEEAAAVVQKIFALCMDGMGPTQIAKWLQENKVLSPVAYCYENDLPTTSKRPTDPYKWATKTVVHMFKGFNLDTESLMTALGKIDGRQVTRLMSELLLEHSNVSFLDTDQSPAVWRPMLKADFDELFCMDLLGAFRLCLAVIKQNYSNFFSDMSTLFGGHVKVSKGAQSKTTENSTESA